jgi:hypothetical protein
MKRAEKPCGYSRRNLLPLNPAFPVIDAADKLTELKAKPPKRSKVQTTTCNTSGTITRDNASFYRFVRPSKVKDLKACITKLQFLMQEECSKQL